MPSVTDGATDIDLTFGELEIDDIPPTLRVIGAFEKVAARRIGMAWTAV